MFDWKLKELKKPQIQNEMNLWLFKFFYFPIKQPETFQALKLVPSTAPCGILICIVCLPGARLPKSIQMGLVTVPGHQFDLLSSEDDSPLLKFPDAGLLNR